MQRAGFGGVRFADDFRVLSSLAATRWQWSSSTRFVVVCTAAVIGLSSFWRMPYLVDTYGGGAFLLVYVLAVLTLGLPLLSGQLLLARGTRADVPGVLARWTRESLHSRAWVWLGGLAVLGAALLLACYAVIGGWSLAYSLRSVAGLLGDMELDQARSRFHALARDAEKGFGWQLVFVGLMVAAAAPGLRRGVEPVMRTLAALLLFGLLLVFGVALLHPDAAAVAKALLLPEFSALGWRGVLEALYQAFFTLSLGAGVIVALGSYLPARAPVVRLACAVVVLDLAATFAAAFALGVLLNGSAALLGSGLEGLFVALPAALDARWSVTLIYVLVALAALAAAIGLFEPVVRTLQCRRRVTRLRASLHAGTGIWLLSLIGLLSFGVPGGFRWQGMNLFDAVLLVVTNAILPIVGLVFCLLLGRVLSLQRLERAWQQHPPPLGHVGFVLWHGSLRYPTRIVLVLVLFYSLGGAALVQWWWG